MRYETQNSGFAPVVRTAADVERSSMAAIVRYVRCWSEASCTDVRWSGIMHACLTKDDAEDHLTVFLDHRAAC